VIACPDICHKKQNKKLGCQNYYYYYFIRENPTLWKAHFMDPGERVKSRLSQALTRSARPDSNSRPAVQISNPLPSRYAS